jgi:tetratricopeptide (TPR) repeat protein
MKTMFSSKLILFSALVCFFFIHFSGSIIIFSNEAPESTEVSIDSVDQLMKVKTIENCEKAIKGYEVLLKKDPGNPEILYKLANAYIVIIDIKTAALIEEKNEYKPILEKMGKKAYDYACQAMEIMPGSREAVGAALVAYGYYSASFGIIKAVFKGAAGRYKDLANQLIKIDDKYDGALGYRSLGKLYEVAPWPVGSSRKALKFFKKAVQADPLMLYSRYYLGFLYYDDDEYELARREFSYVIENPPHSSEAHFIETYISESRKYLKKIAEKLK